MSQFVSRIMERSVSSASAPAHQNTMLSSPKSKSTHTRSKQRHRPSSTSGVAAMRASLDSTCGNTASCSSEEEHIQQQHQPLVSPSTHSKKKRSSRKMKKLSSSNSVTSAPLEKASPRSRRGTVSRTRSASLMQKQTSSRSLSSKKKKSKSSKDNKHNKSSASRPEVAELRRTDRAIKRSVSMIKPSLTRQSSMRSVKSSASLSMVPSMSRQKSSRSIVSYQSEQEENKPSPDHSWGAVRRVVAKAALEAYAMEAAAAREEYEQHLANKQQNVTVEALSVEPLQDLAPAAAAGAEDDEDDLGGVEDKSVDRSLDLDQVFAEEAAAETEVAETTYGHQGSPTQAGGPPAVDLQALYGMEDKDKSLDLDEVFVAKKSKKKKKIREGRKRNPSPAKSRRGESPTKPRDKSPSKRRDISPSKRRDISPSKRTVRTTDKKKKSLGNNNNKTKEELGGEPTQPRSPVPKRNRRRSTKGESPPGDQTACSEEPPILFIEFEMESDGAVETTTKAATTAREQRQNEDSDSSSPSDPGEEKEVPITPTTVATSTSVSFDSPLPPLKLYDDSNTSDETNPVVVSDPPGPLVSAPSQEYGG